MESSFSVLAIKKEPEETETAPSGSMLVSVIKREICPHESTDISIEQSKYFTSESENVLPVKSENAPSDWVDVLVAKTEFDCKTEITHDLVSRMSNVELLRDGEVSAVAVKIENQNIKNENVNQENEDSSAQNEVLSDINEGTLFNGFQGDRDLQSSKFNVSVKLVDIFSVNDQRQGSAHINSKLCQCIFCQPIYDYKSVLQLLSRNLSCQKQIMSTQLKHKSSSSHKSFTIKKSWYQNMKKKSYIRKCKCPECGVVCISSTILEIHMRKHTGERPYECKRCPATFKRKSHLESHKRMKHSDIRPFKCVECQSAFKDKGDLTKHLRIHSNERPFACKECGAAFKRDNHLKYHMIKHVELHERPFKCTLCSLTFTRNNLFNAHLRQHRIANPFKCNQCASAFKSRYLLKNHLAIHDGEKPFKCEHCSMTFLRKCELKLHLIRRHTCGKVFTCYICSATFKMKYDLDKHSSRRHFDSDTAKFECEICKKKFPTKQQIRHHMEGHSDEKPYKCEMCSFKSRKQYHLKKHLLIHSGGKLTSCKFCSVPFCKTKTLIHHMEIQHGYIDKKKKFICGICSTAVSHKHNLIKHIAIKHTENTYTI